MSSNSILVVVEQFRKGGLETHIESEVRSLNALGWKVHLAVSEVEETALLPKELKGIITGLDIGPLATSDQLLLSVATLTRYVERHKIAVVHCHPFVSSLAAFLTAGRCGLSLAFTLHGPLSLGKNYGVTFETFLRRFILPNSSLVVCVSPEVARLARVAGTASNTIVLPNPIRLPDLTKRGQNDGGKTRIAFAARLEHDKLTGFRDLLTKLPEDVDWQLDVFGSGGAVAAVDALIAESSFKEQISMMGWSTDLNAVLPNYDVAAGMGRVVLEAAAADVPVMLVGYDGVKGLLDNQMFSNASYTNFSGRGLATIEHEEVKSQIKAAAEDPLQFKLRSVVAEVHSEMRIWTEFSKQLLNTKVADTRAAELLHQALVRTSGSTAPLLQDHNLLDVLSGNQQFDKSAILDQPTMVTFSYEPQCDPDPIAEGLSGLRVTLLELIKRIDDKTRDSALDHLVETLAASNVELSALRTQIDEIWLTNVTKSEDQNADRRTLERLEEDWRSLEMRVLEKLVTVEQWIAALIIQASRVTAEMEDFKANEHWPRIVQELQSQHARERALIERESERRIDALSEQLKMGTRNLEVAQAEVIALTSTLKAAIEYQTEYRSEVARLREALTASESEAEACKEKLDLLNQSFEATYRDAQVPAAVSSHYIECSQSNKSVQALRQIVKSLEARSAAVVQEVRELRGRAAVLKQLHVGLEVSTEASARFGISGLVSIVLPVYNQASFLSEAIEGVLQQTYPHWELIIVDDGSTDTIDSVLARYTADRRIRVVRQSNQKLPSALNNGNFFTRGEYMTWTSADNIMLPEQLAELILALESTPSAGLAYSDYEAIDDRGSPLTDPAWRRHNRSDGSSIIRLPRAVTLENFHRSGDNFLGASFLWRTALQAIVGPYDEGTFGGEDYDMWLRMHLVTEFVHVPKVLYKYRVHDATLNARAKELNLFTNIEKMLSINARRREELIGDGALLTPDEGYLRSPGQYKAPLISNMDFLSYFEFLSRRAEGTLLRDNVKIVTIDSRLQDIDVGVLSDCDIILVPDNLVFCWLRRLKLPRHLRLLAGDRHSMSAAVIHAASLRYFERILEDKGQPLSSMPHAQPIANISGRGIALILQRWGVGGMEQIVLELAIGLARQGARVTVCLVEKGDHEHLWECAAEYGLSILELEGNVELLLAHCRSNSVLIAHYHYCTFGAKEVADEGIHTVYTFHNSYVWLTRHERAALATDFARLNTFIAVSRQVASFARATFGITKPIIVVPNGTDVDNPGASAFTNSNLLLADTRDARRFRFLAVGTLTPHKLHDRLLAAFGGIADQLPDAQLTIVGSSHDETWVKRLRDIRGDLPNPDACDIITGLSRSNVISLMRSHHCLVMPSLVEGWSISLLEAAIVGMVCITSDVGAARDFAQIAKSVVLVPAPGGDVLQLDNESMWATLNKPLKNFEVALGRTMVDVVNRFDSLDSMAKSAAPSFAEAFSMDSMVKAHLQVYQES